MKSYVGYAVFTKTTEDTKLDAVANSRTYPENVVIKYVVEVKNIRLYLLILHKALPQALRLQNTGQHSRENRLLTFTVQLRMMQEQQRGCY